MFSNFFISLNNIVSWKIIIFHFFRFYYAEMRRKLWPKAPAKEDALGQMSKKFQVAKEIYCDATIFFFDSLLSTCPKKMETEKWPMAADPLLLGICSKNFKCKNVFVYCELLFFNFDETDIKKYIIDE